MRLFIFLCLIATFIPFYAYAGPQKALKKGFVWNDAGKKCWFTQEFQDGVIHFTEKHTQDIGIITFDDPNCMSDSGLGLDANKMMVNNLIAKWYSHDDADFQTHPSDMYASSKMQIKGQCIQSKTYSMAAIAIEYEINSDSITRVWHGDAVGGCSN